MLCVEGEAAGADSCALHGNKRVTSNKLFNKYFNEKILATMRSERAECVVAVAVVVVFYLACGISAFAMILIAIRDRMSGLGSVTVCVRGLQCSLCHQAALTLPPSFHV